MLRALLLTAGLLLGLAPAASAAQREGAVSAASPTFNWSGGPLYGTIIYGPVDDTLIEVQSPGMLSVSTRGTSPTDLLADIDIYLYATDTTGAPVGNPLASSATGGSSENLQAQIDEPGSYVVEASAFLGSKATYSATASLEPTATAAAAMPDAKPTAKISNPKAAAKAVAALKGSARDDHGVARVDVAVTHVSKHNRCTSLTAQGSFKPSKSCKPSFVKATGTQAWSFRLKHRLHKGVYAIYVRVTDSAGHQAIVKQALKVS